MATKREPSWPAASRKYSIITSGSIVVPDFEAIDEQRAVDRHARTASGSVVSSTSSGPPKRAAEAPAARGSSRPCRRARCARSRGGRPPPTASARAAARPSRSTTGSQPIQRADLGGALGVVATRGRRRPRTAGGRRRAPSSSASAASACGRASPSRRGDQARPVTSRTASTTASGEMPSSRATALPGRRGAEAVDADALPRSPDPALPAERGAGLDRDARRDRRAAAPRRGRPASCWSKSSQHGIETTRTPMPSACSVVAGRQRVVHLGAGRHDDGVGAPSASAST